MNFRMTLGGSKEEQHHGNEHYTEGYNAGYTSAVEEMRRRARGFSEHGTVEDRRGRRARSDYEQHYPVDDIHWPMESRQIGFTGEQPRSPRHMPPIQREDLNMLMDMLNDVKMGQEQFKQGMTSALPLDPRFEGLLESATQVLSHPPATWAPYAHRKDFAGIAKMEGKELLAALDAKKPVQDIRKELTHTIAALFQLVSAQ